MQPQSERLRGAGGGPRLLETAFEHRPVARVDELEYRGSDDRVSVVAEHGVDRLRLPAHDEVRSHDRDDVGRIAHERRQPSLAALEAFECGAQHLHQQRDEGGSGGTCEVGVELGGTARRVRLEQRAHPRHIAGDGQREATVERPKHESEQRQERIAGRDPQHEEDRDKLERLSHQLESAAAVSEDPVDDQRAGCERGGQPPRCGGPGR